MNIIDDFAEKVRFRIIDHDDKYSRFIKFHKTLDVIILDLLIHRLKSDRVALRYVNEGERLEL